MMRDFKLIAHQALTRPTAIRDPIIVFESEKLSEDRRTVHADVFRDDERLSDTKSTVGRTSVTV